MTHDSQGRGQVDLDRPAGVATAIRAHGRWRSAPPTEESWTPRVELDAGLRQRVVRAIATGCSPAAVFDGPPELATGAGHDAGILATAGIPTAMLFVRNPTGVSHAPDEHAELDDCLTGVVALADVLEDLVCR